MARWLGGLSTPVPGPTAYSMGKNTLISEALLCDVFRLIYFLIDVDIPDEARKLCLSIESVISDKVRRNEIRNAFSAYKAEPPGPQRELLRQKYIKLAQIYNDFVSSHEIPYSSL